MAPARSVSFGLGMMRSGSKNSTTPIPPHRLHHPAGLLNENSRGSISSMVKPETGQAKRAEKVTRSDESASSVISRPSDNRSAVSVLSARRDSRPSRITMRSTTTSMSWLRWRSSVGGSSVSYRIPSILTRWKPCRRRSSRSFLNSPLRFRTTGLRRRSRVPGGCAIMASTICVTVWLVMGKPVAGE